LNNLSHKISCLKISQELVMPAGATTLQLTFY
jgi:hypothetical protein